MWQTAISLLIVAGVLVYLIRRLSKAYRSEASVCSSCPADCAWRGHIEEVAGEECPAHLKEQTAEDGRLDRG
jgi:hypothetical protein